MSMQSWRDEFFPVDATDPSALASDAAALKHSLRKWIGAQEHNTEKHEVEYGGLASSVVGQPLDKGHTLYGGVGNEIIFDSSTCALCERAIRRANVDSINSYCQFCPIYKVTGKDCGNAYARSEHTPVPMINLLKLVSRKLNLPTKKKKAKKAIKKKAKKKAAKRKPKPAIA